MKSDAPFKSGYVTIVGRPNVGKSTLINALLRFRLSIVTPKPQTTRHRILGILSESNFQAIFLDTPGLITPQYKLQEAMAHAVATAVADADIVLFTVDASQGIIAQEIQMCRSLPAPTPVIAAINKIDLVEKNALLPLIDRIKDELGLTTIVPISALKGEGLDDLKMAIVALLPAGPAFYPDDQLTEHPERFFVAEIIREHIFWKYGEEIPYAAAVLIDEFKEREHGKDYIKARIIVERTSQKAILIGKGGRALKEVGRLARQEIEAFLGREVFLELWVSVQEKWRSKDLYLREFGYT